MNGFNILLYKISQFCYTTYSKFIIPNIPILLYHLSYFGKTKKVWLGHSILYFQIFFVYSHRNRNNPRVWQENYIL